MPLTFKRTWLRWLVRALVLSTTCCLEQPSTGAQLSWTPDQRDAKLLCGEIPGPIPRVLIGRFPVFGEFKQGLGQILEQGFVSNLYLALLQQQNDVKVFIWTDTSESLQNKGLEVLIDNAFDDRKSATVEEPAAVRNKAALGRALEEHNCNFLFGGRISREGPHITVVPYLINVSTGELYQPFSPSAGEIQSISKIAERVAKQLGNQLSPTQHDDLKNNFIALGCFGVVGSTPGSVRSSVESLAILLRRYVAETLIDDNRFSVRKTGSKLSPCPAPPVQSAGDAAATVTGEIRVREHKKIEIQPSIEFGSKAIFRLPAITQPFSPSSMSSLPGDVASRVRSFLIAVTQTDGSFPTDNEVIAATDIDDPTTMSLSLQGGNILRAALVAYRELAKNPQSGYANFVLARVFDQKGERDLALEYFMKAKDSDSSFTAVLRGELNERIGETLVALKNPNGSTKYFVASKELYRSTGEAAAAKRVGRRLATALFLDGKKSEAVEELKQQSDLDHDGESLRLLGRFLSLSERHDEAVQWLSKAVFLNPGDDIAKTLLAGAHEALGRTAFASGQFIIAREQFGLALESQPNGQLFYLSGVSAYEIGDFRDAANQLEKVIRSPPQKTSLKLVEGAWLTLLECYLLLGDYAALDSQGEDASAFLRWLPDSRLLAAYIRLMGNVLSNPKANVAELKKNVSYTEIDTAPPAASATNLQWDNTRVTGYLTNQGLDAEKQAFVSDVTQRVWRDPKTLQ